MTPALYLQFVEVLQLLHRQVQGGQVVPDWDGGGGAAGNKHI